MGDRTSVEITVLADQAEQTFNILKEYMHFPKNWGYEDVIDDDDYSFSYVDLNTKSDMILFILSEVNYANVDSESSELCKLGIAHNVKWHEGCNYNAGRSYFRFNADGTQKIMEDLPDEDTPSVNVYEILAKLDTLSIEEIKNYLNGIIEEFTEPSWLHQLEYGILATQVNETVRE